ncbi:MAG: glycosyltransferase family 2 protein [Chitinophagales bacterium]|nr:glycosyltransferase family 2 protein [Chitinophagales bacterium]
MAKVSIVAPVFNEEENIRVLYDKLCDVLQPLTIDDFEIIFINDGSTDSSIQIIKSLAAQDEKVKFIDFSRNFGHQNAVFAGLENCKGEAIVIIDTDLQDPPEVIAGMYDKFRLGFDVVYAKRLDRKGESWHKLLTAKFFYLFINKLSDTPIPLNTGDFRLISKRVNQIVCTMPERNKFLRGQIAWTGFQQTFVEYNRLPRFKGETKYPYAKMFKFAFDGISAFSNIPLKIATWLGFFTATVATGLFLWTFYVRLFTNNYVQGWSSMMIVMLFLGGVQLICIGILGEYLGRVLDNVKGRPPFIIKDTNINKKE